jgi:hypothetical protein
MSIFILPGSRQMAATFVLVEPEATALETMIVFLPV